MKKFAKLLLVFLAATAVIFFMGPRPKMDDKITFDEGTLGNDLDAYLATSEASVSNVREGAEKEIIWANPSTKEQTDIAIVYVHGFSATKQEIRPVPDKVAEALDANLYFTRLAGHGQPGEAMGEVTTADWITDYSEAMAIGRRLGKRTLVISTSTGSTIAAWAAVRRELSENIAGIVMISPNFEMQGISTALANIPWAEAILPAIAGYERSWEPINEEHGKWWTSRYPTKAIFPIAALLRDLKSADKSAINIPALFVYSPEDRVIVTSEVEKMAEEWGGPTRIEQVQTKTDPFHHVVAGDILSPDNNESVSSLIIEWTNSLF